jgi:hypothetical protein
MTRIVLAGVLTLRRPVQRDRSGHPTIRVPVGQADRTDENETPLTLGDSITRPGHLMLSPPRCLRLHLSTFACASLPVPQPSFASSTTSVSATVSATASASIPASWLSPLPLFLGFSIIQAQLSFMLLPLPLSLSHCGSVSGTSASESSPLDHYLPSARTSTHDRGPRPSRQQCSRWAQPRADTQTCACRMPTDVATREMQQPV